MIYCEKHGARFTDSTGLCPDCPMAFTQGIEFSGKVAEQITGKELETVVGMLNAGGTPEIHHLLHHCIDEEIEKIFGKKTESVNPMSVFGMEIRRVSWVPLGEIWAVSKDGKVVKKFSTF